MNGQDSEPQSVGENDEMRTVVPPTEFNASPRPVAYDADGQPLYAGPPPTNQPMPTDDTNKSDNSTAPLDEEVQQKHNQSVEDYPFIQFLPQEYVAIDVARSNFGFFKNWLVPLSTAILMVIALLVIGDTNLLNRSIKQDAFLAVLALGSIILLVSVCSAALATHIFRKNLLVVTTERVFRREQLTPFSFNDQEIELSHITNCSFSQNGIIQEIMSYGSIILKTIGDEANYRFNYVSDPDHQFQTINTVIEEANNRTESQ
ncbi:MAG: hypothetical protein WAW91_01085 [Candidatus Nanoperiomorbaceae bacterium]